MKLEGCYTAIVTPFTADGTSVDLRRLGQQIQYQIAGGVRGIVPCGTTGESPTLTEMEHASVVEAAVAHARGSGVQVIAGAGSNSTAHAVHLHRLVRSLGADAALQVVPYYNKPSQEGLYRHFMAVADSADLAVVLYNIPGRSGVPLLPETIERLAAHSNIVAVKEASGSIDSASEIRRRCSITILSGDDSLTLAFASVGARGVVSVVSNIVPDRVQKLCTATLSNDFDCARRVHEELLPLARGLLSIDTNPAPVKAAMELLGRDSGALRLPMCRLSNEAMNRVSALLAAAQLRVSPVAAGVRA
ncbi:MAG: 4-hydroxy-tetrahydrodipicolinate synthase [Phycisphaerales bacterium]|nr:4-hydroxy-tetrahydrodipicolinate synthase [Phycisphaerales bacterium]